MSVSIEAKMSLKLFCSVEELVKSTRNCGPFGGVPIERVSVPNIMSKAEEAAEYRIKKLEKSGELHSMTKVIRVFFEDKYEKSKRIAVEKYSVELVRIPENLNGFEFLCHPHLEKEENLIAYFKAWHSTTIVSLYYLIQNSPVMMYFLSPTSPEEQEVSYQLRKRYNLSVETEENDVVDSPKDKDPLDSDGLSLILSSRHDIRRIFNKVKVYQMKNYSSIVQNLETQKRESTATPQGGYSIKAQNRARFFSDELPEQAILQRRKRKAEAEEGGYKYSMDTSTNPANNSLDLMNSYRHHTSRPFRLQEELIEEKANNSRRRMSVALSLVDSSLTNMYRKNSQYNQDELQYTLAEVQESPKKNSGHASDDVNVFGKRNRRVGLARIGSELLQSGNMGDEMMDMDEDDRIVAISNSLECVQMSCKVVQKLLTEKLSAKQGSSFVPARLILNFIDSNNKPIDQFLNLGEWIDAQKDAQNQAE